MDYLETDRTAGKEKLLQISPKVEQMVGELVRNLDLHELRCELKLNRFRNRKQLESQRRQHQRKFDTIANQDSIYNTQSASYSDSKDPFTSNLSLNQGNAKTRTKLIQMNKSVDFCTLDTSLESIIPRGRNPVDNVQSLMDLEWKVTEARKILAKDFFAQKKKQMAPVLKSCENELASIPKGLMMPQLDKGFMTLRQNMARRSIGVQSQNLELQHMRSARMEDKVKRMRYLSQVLQNAKQSAIKQKKRPLF